MTLKDEYDAILDMWKTLKAWRNALPDTDDDWARFANDTIGLSKKYGEADFAVDLAVALSNEIERCSKRQKLNGSRS